MISLMFLTGIFAKVAVSNAMKAMTAAVAWMLPKRRAKSDARKRRPLHQRTRFSHPKRRHPHQVMQWEELEVGREYTSVHIRECDGRMFEYRRTFAGVFPNLPEESQLPPKGRGHYADMRFTVHPDGRHFDGSSSDKPSYLLWGGDNKPNSYSSVAYLLGEDDVADQHQLLVPTDRWQADHSVSVDWTEERPCGEMGEMVWMYDTLDHRQIAAVISGRSLHAPDDVYYVTFVRGREIGGGGSCNLQRQSELTVRRDSEQVDEFWQKHRG